MQMKQGRCQWVMLLLVLLMGTAWAAEQAASVSGDHARIMSFNIRYGTARDGANHWDRRHDLVARVLREQDCDVVGLQEALRFQINYLLEAVPVYGHVGVGRDDGKGQGEFSGLLYRTDRLLLDDSGTFWLSGTPTVPGSITWGNACTRICTWARFVNRKSYRAFYVFNVHLDHVSQVSREKAMDLLLRRMEIRNFPDPVVVTGDFNAGEDNPAIKALKEYEKRPFVDTFRVLHPDQQEVGTFNGFKGTRTGAKIDYVFAQAQTIVLEARILKDAFEGRWPSDHFPVRATLQFGPVDKGVWPQEQWQQVSPESVGMDVSRLRQAREFALTGAGSGCIMRHGKQVMQWGDVNRRYDLKSSTKAIGVTCLGLALQDGLVNSLDEPATVYHPSLGVPPESNVQTGWIQHIRLWHLATQTAGFDKNGGYTQLLFKPGAQWCYSDGGPNWLAECLTLIYKQDLNDLMFQRVFGPIGITPKDLTWRKHAYRAERLKGFKRREFGSGIHANVLAMARIGYLYLRRGYWQGRQIVPTAFVGQVGVVPAALKGLEVVRGESYFNAADHYGLLWWNNADGTMKNVPRDAYWSWGLYDSLIVVIPSLEVVIARAGKSLNKGWNSSYAAIEPLIEPVVLSVKSDDR
jgi:endonuclease/exonuclease/phosphatase family metal-dependent hydrolase/CubicO group peptidase (beta-lactamase class C family)